MPEEGLTARLVVTDSTAREAYDKKQKLLVTAESVVYAMLEKVGKATYKPQLKKLTSLIDFTPVDLSALGEAEVTYTGSEFRYGKYTISGSPNGLIVTVQPGSYRFTVAADDETVEVTVTVPLPEEFYLRLLKTMDLPTGEDPCDRHKKFEETEGPHKKLLIKNKQDKEFLFSTIKKKLDNDGLWKSRTTFLGDPEKDKK